MKEIRIAHLYYDLMNLYGENGNIRYLKKQLEDQGFKVTINFLTVNDKIDFKKYDFYYIGMGSDDNRDIVLKDIIQYKNNIKDAIFEGKYFLVTGNSLDLFGRQITHLNGEKAKALGIFDYEVKAEEFRIVGEQYYETSLIDKKIVGFQNRSSIIDGYSKPLFKVINGTGYKPNDSNEGILMNHFYGTYLLGPILVRNPYLTKYLVKEICNSFKISYKDIDEDVSYKAYYEYLNNFYSE